MKARIRSGAIVGQDHGLGALTQEMAGKVFDVHPFSETWVKLTAWGYGESGKGSYGNGALYVKKEDVIPVEEKRNPYERKEGVKFNPAPDELAEEIHRAYAYFVSRQLPCEAHGEVSQAPASSFEADRMFQAWLALKLALAKSPAMQAGSDPPRPDVFWAGPPGARGDAQGPG